jgi:ubiquitin carboxyl-terminal hydrolase 36/42
MLGRVSVRPSCLRTIEPSKEQQSIVKVELDSCTENPVEHLSPIESMDATNSGFPAPENENSEVGSEHHESGTGNEDPDDMIGVDDCSSLSIPVEVSGLKKDSAAALDSEAVVIEHSLGYTDTVMSESDSAVAKDIQVNGSIYSFSSEEIST